MIEFAKYHGCGNNFIIVREEAVLGRNFSELAVALCNVNTGIGADGLIIIRSIPVLEMIFYNCDGSQAPMCGNGIRCFANYCFDETICREMKYDVLTLAGVMQVNVQDTGAAHGSFSVKIDMGYGRDFVNRQLETAQGIIEMHDCFMGTVHTVVFLEDFANYDITTLGKELSNHEAYPEKTNVNFVQIIDDKTLRLRTYERGVGLTMACGTGACASVLIGIRNGICQQAADVLLPLGKLHITQNADGLMTMTGPAEKIAAGIYIGG